ncbi:MULTISPECIES: LPS export ABC transporter permease LptF [Sphingobium]|uniref:YjgP/YjgQ family permease n=2 Tax=Sphingobium cupriresistens TaxID=1132417 RepID=A0A0J7Y0T5_9SPHN|nr:MULTISPECIES: LPS export ABC transporter permease LptF [Sphingobium]KMS57402.1 YjgP/YjgQ family permease [Sphingobium cupriresistens LL01]MBJ7375391.1 LPS export ABC transporter permease LptF [Sphingobium sp.]MBJ7375434.1 LPS export ABC transporter permease LptF [Sphingobium sp.]RYM14913.1 LPS export ABC transporter permease LptF [Sphingobium cupriresistens]WCP14416.1 Lipopolysaccharide export system permease protein LptF [Sphingobium sp. AntQ-1]
MLTATDRYLARLIAVPMLGTLVIAAMLLVLDKMLSLFDFVAAEGGPVSVVWRMLANMLPEYLSLGIPIGLMLGILLAFRKLALSSELDVMRAVGLSYGRLLRVPYMYAIALALLNFGIVGFVQPLSRHAYEALRFELRSGALGASIKVGEFTNLGKRMTLRIERSLDEGRNLQGIFVRAVSRDGQSVAVTAAQGTFLATDDPDVIIFRLRNGVLVNDAPKYKTPRILSFSSHDLPIDLPQIENFRGRDVDREKTIPELMVIGKNPATPEKLKDEVRANFHFRMVEVVFMFLLPLAALAFAIPPKRSTSALGVFLSIVFIVTYHKVNQYGEGIGALGKVDPIIALWGPFLLASGLVLWMYHVIANRPGGQPIGALEVAFSKLGKHIVRLLRFGRRRPAAQGAA